MNDSVKEKIEKEKIIVIVRGVKEEKLIPLADALYDGGIRLMEVTFDAGGLTSDEKTAEGIKKLSRHFEGKMHIGAGTVLSEKQAELTENAGGRFVISPDTSPAVIKRTKELGLISIPGALTPSEIQLAHKSGADFVKLFPIANLGAAYVKAVKAPLSHIKLMGVGGINEKNMAEYFKAGVMGFGVGQSIVSAGALEKNDYKAITEAAKKYVSAVRECQTI